MRTVQLISRQPCLPNPKDITKTNQNYQRGATLTYLEKRGIHFSEAEAAVGMGLSPRRQEVFLRALIFRFSL